MSVRVTKPVRRVVGDRAHPASMPGPHGEHRQLLTGRRCGGATTIPGPVASPSSPGSAEGPVGPAGAAENWASPWDTVLWGRASSARSDPTSRRPASAASHPRCTDACTASSSDRTPNGARVGHQRGRRHVADRDLSVAVHPGERHVALGRPAVESGVGVADPPTGWPATGQGLGHGPGPSHTAERRCGPPARRSTARRSHRSVRCRCAVGTPGPPSRSGWSRRAGGVTGGQQGLAASARLPAPRVR